MHIQFSFFQPSSFFSWDTHSKQSFCLDEEWFLWLSFCSLGPWSNSFDLCRTLHALNASLSCIYASCISLYAVFWLFLHLVLLLCFCFCVCKNPKTQKSEKFKKFDRICLSTFHMWVWPCTFVQMALCIYELSLFFLHLYLCGKNLEIYVWLL